MDGLALLQGIFQTQRSNPHLFMSTCIGRHVLYNCCYLGSVYICTYIPSFLSLPAHSHPTPPGHCKMPGWAPCVIQQPPTTYLFYLNLIEYIFQCCFLNLSYPLLPPLCPQVHSLCLCHHFFPANRFISTFFLDFIYIYIYIYIYICINIW